MGCHTSRVEPDAVQVQSETLQTPSEDTAARCVARERFRHQPLSIDPQEIRLFRLEPELSADGLIQCSIKHIKLDDFVPYIAVSYCWGPPKPSMDILLDGQPLNIRTNLCDFLCTMREQRVDGLENWFWADQICIDQANVVERNHQVQQMQYIYMRATRVHAWLGQASEDSSRAVDAIRRYVCFRQWDDAVTQDAMLSFFSRPYWKRLWVVQELALAKEVVFFCGIQAIAWPPLYYVLESHIDYKHASRLITTIGLKPKIEKPLVRDFDLLRAIDRFSEHDCEDPRDRVYGLQGVVSREDQLSIDYDKTIHEVYIDTVEFLLRKYANFRGVHYLEETTLFGPIIQLGRHMGVISPVWRDQDLEKHLRTLWDETCKEGKASALREFAMFPMAALKWRIQHMFSWSEHLKTWT